MSDLESIRKITGDVRPSPKADEPVCQVTPGLFLSTFAAIQDQKKLSDLGVTVEINVAPTQCVTGTDFYGSEVKYAPFDIVDTDEFPVKNHFDEVLDVIRDTIQGGGASLLHCARSVSRGSVFIIAYLVREKGMTVAEATVYLKEKWEATWPNDGFVRQLLEYEQELKDRETKK